MNWHWNLNTNIERYSACCCSTTHDSDPLASAFNRIRKAQYLASLASSDVARLLRSLRQFPPSPFPLAPPFFPAPVLRPSLPSIHRGLPSPSSIAALCRCCISMGDGAPWLAADLKTVAVELNAPPTSVNPARWSSIRCQREPQSNGGRARFTACASILPQLGQAVYTSELPLPCIPPLLHQLIEPPVPCMPAPASHVATPLSPSSHHPTYHIHEGLFSMGSESGRASRWMRLPSGVDLPQIFREALLKELAFMKLVHCKNLLDAFKNVE